MKMKALRLFKDIGQDGKLVIQIPKEMGTKFEIIILPVHSEKYDSDSAEYFECVAEDGTEYKVHDWTDEDWQAFSLRSFMNTEDDKDVDWEEFFGIKNGCDTMQAIRTIQEVDESGMVRFQVPLSFGRRVELIVVPLSPEDGREAQGWETMKLQEETGFARKVLADPGEDVWNDL